MNNYPGCPNSESPGGMSPQGAVKCAYPTSVFQGAVCLSGKDLLIWVFRGEWRLFLNVSLNSDLTGFELR